MHVRVTLHGVLRKRVPAADNAGSATVDVPDGATVADVIAQLGIPPKHAGMLVSGNEHLELGSVLSNGQELNVFPPLAGGRC